MKRIVYHDNDPDGWMSAAIIKKEYPNIELIGCIRDRDPEFVSGYDEVYIVDYSFTKEQMDFLKNNNKKLIWIDHHKAIIEKYEGLYEGLQREDKAGAGLTWEYMHPDEEMPLAVYHINNKDLWNHEHEDTQYIGLFVKTFKPGTEVKEFIKFIDWNEEQIKKAATTGRIINRFLDHEIEQTVDVGMKQDFLGHKAYVMYGEASRSQIAHRALDKFPDVEIAVVSRGAGFDKDGNKLFKYSMRSKRGGVNVAEIAIRYGGGGHPYAAGFISKEVL